MRRSLTLLLISATTAASQQPVPAEAGARVSVTGIVFDSVANRPLVRATIQFTGASGTVAGRSTSAVTDTAGRFVVRELQRGQYVAGFFHDALDTLGLTPLHRRSFAPVRERSEQIPAPWHE